MIARNPMSGDPEVFARPERRPDPEVPERAQQRRYSATYKQRFLSEYEGLDKTGKGALLRREGLYLWGSKITSAPPLGAWGAG